MGCRGERRGLRMDKSSFHRLLSSRGAPGRCRVGILFIPTRVRPPRGCVCQAVSPPVTQVAGKVAGLPSPCAGDRMS